MKVAICVSYCSNERCFIRPLLDQALQCADQVVVALGSHFYDYEPEDMKHLMELATEYPNVFFAMYPVSQAEENNPLQRKDAYWHNIARISAWRQVRIDIDWILFLDGDEIPDASAFKSWFQANKHLLDDQAVYKLANYWYFKEPTHQALTWEDSCILVPTTSLSFRRLMHDMERDGLADHMTVHRNVVHHETKLPMFHHFSWVRSLPCILKKVATWGHRTDRNWVQYIQDSWDKPAAEVDDFVHGYKYTQVPNYFNIQLHDL